MQYLCELCNYTAKNASCFSHHKNTKKHIQLASFKVNTPANNMQDISFVSIKLASISANTSIEANLNCILCNQQFNHKSSLSRHKKICNNKKNNPNNELNMKIELIKQECKIEILEKEKELYKKLEKEKSELLTNFMNNANILLNKTTDNNKITTQAIQNVSMSALKYANDKFKDTPVLIPIENFNINELSFENAEEKGQLTEILIYNAKQNSLDKR